MRNRIFIFILLISSISTTALAYDGEYWTYNGFGPIANAFRFIALIFGTNDYKALFFSVIVAGILFGGIGAYYKLLSSSGSGSTLSWVWPIGLGIMLYIAFFIPKGNLTVYDKVLNRFETIGSIPDGLIVTASALNTIERGIVQMIQDSGQPLSFFDSAGGVGFNALLAMSDPLSAIGAKSKISNAQNFINDCVLFEMQRPGTTLTADVINQTDQKFVDLFAAAQNNAVLTAWTMSDGSTANNVTCTEAYGYLKTEWSSTAAAQDINGICASQGFDISNSTEMSRCKEIVGQTITVAMGAAGMDATQFFAQASLASVLRASTVGGNLDGAIVKQADVNTKTGMMSVGLVANEYLPVMRAVVTAIAIGMVPFIVIFLPTPLGTKAVGFVVGFFVWLTAWGITDAITHQMAIDYANAYFGQARQNNIGYAAMLTIPDAASRTLGLFGMIRTSGVMLATVITTMLLKFGGHVMGQMAGQFHRDIQGAGARASGIATAEGASGKVSQYSGAVATMANAGRFSMGQEAAAREYSSGVATQDSLQQIDHLGGKGGYGHGNVSQAISRSGNAHAIDKSSQTMSTLKSSGELGGAANFISQDSDISGSRRVGDIQATRRNAGALGLGNDFAGLASLRRLKENGLTDERSTAAANKALGFSDGHGPVKPGMHMDWSAGDDGKLMVNRVDWQHGNESGSISGGAMTLAGTWGAGGEGVYRAVQAAMRADDNRHGHFSKGMAGMIGEKAAVNAERELRRAGRTEEANTVKDFIRSARANHDFRQDKGITNDEALSYRMVQSMDGKTAEIGVRHGTDTSWFDTSSERQGMTIRKGDDIDRGDHVSLGNTIKLDEGTHIAPQTASQMALEGNSLLVSQISRSGLNDEQRDAQRLAVAASVADGMGSLIKRSGTSTDYSSAEGAVGTPRFLGFGGSAAAGYRTTDDYNSSLMAHHYNEVLKTAHHDATSKGLNKREADALAAGRLQGAVQEEVRYFEEHGKWSYGATGGVTRVGKAVTGDEKGKRD